MLLGFYCFAANSDNADAFDGNTGVRVVWERKFSFSKNSRFAVSPNSKGVAVFDVTVEKLLYFDMLSGEEVRTWDVPLGTEFPPEIFFVPEALLVWQRTPS